MYSSASHPNAMRQSSTGSLGSYGESSSSGGLGGGAHQPPLSQQHFSSSSSYADYSSPVQPSRSMHGDGGSGSSSGGMRGGGGHSSSSYAPAPSGSSGTGMKYAQQQQPQGGQSNAMAPRAPGGSSYSSSGLSNGGGGGGGSGRDLTPISHPGMHRSSQQQQPMSSQQQQRYSSSSSSYQALPSAYNGNVGPIGSLPSSSSSNLLSDPWADTSSPIGGGSNSSYAQYPAMAGSAQSLMPLPPHPSAVPPAKGGAGGASKKSNNAAAAAHSSVPGGFGAPFLPSSTAAQSADPPEPELPKPPRVDLAVRKQTLDALLGDAATAHTYWNLVEKYLLVKLSKSELDAFVIEKLGRQNLHVHNDFFLAVLQNALSDELPPKPARKKGEPRKPKIKTEAGAIAKGGAMGKKSDATIKKERKPRSDKKKDAGALGADGKKAKRKSRSGSGALADEELLTSVGAYLASPHLHAGSAHKPMAHLLRPAQYFEALENLKHSGSASNGASAAGTTVQEYGQGGNFDAGAADLSGAWANGTGTQQSQQQQTANRVVVPNGVPPVDGHLQAPRRVYSASNSVSIEHAQQMVQTLFKPRHAARAPQHPHPHTSQLALPRAKSVSPRSSIMQDDSAAASAASSSGPSSLHASSSTSALSTVLHTPSSASPSRLVRDVLPLSFTSDYIAHWEHAATTAAEQQRRKSFQTHLRSARGSSSSAAADPNGMDDDEAASPSATAAAAAATDSDLNCADDDEADCDDDEEELLDESDPYARLGDPETRAYLSALYSQRVPDRDAVRKRLYTSALHSGVPNVSEAAVTLLQQATEEHLKSIIASILEYARPDKRGSMVRVLEQNTVGAFEPEAPETSMEDQTAAAAANGAAAGAFSVTPPSANAAVVPMDESAQRPMDTADDALAAEVPAAATSAPAAATPGNAPLPPQPQSAAMQDASASAASATAVSSSSAAAASSTPAAAPATAASSAMELSESMTPAQRIAYVRDAISGPHSDPLMLPPLVHNTWASINAHMPVDRSDSPLPPLRVDAPMRMPLSAAQLTAALHQYPELLSNATAPLILERLSACQ